MADDTTRLVETVLPVNRDDGEAALSVTPRHEFHLSSQDETPEYLRTPDVLTGYRVHFSVALCLRSIFRLHNETSNIHTHLLGALGVVAAWLYLQLSGLAHLDSVAPLVVIALYCLAVTWLLLCSSVFHTCNCASPSAYLFCARLDYSGIGLVILMSQWGALYFGLRCWDGPFYAFVGILAFFTIVVVLGPLFRQFHAVNLRLVRALIYVVLSVVFPVVWWLMLAVRFGFASQVVMVLIYKGMFLCYAGYGAGIFFYISRFPERCWPGSFDYFPSHTFWHFGVLAGAGLLLYSFAQSALIIGDQTCEQLLNSTWLQ